MGTQITKELLIENGWIQLDDSPGFILEKPIENRNPINNTPDDTDIRLVLHVLLNTPQFAILLPGGGLLNFVANSIEELIEFENKINYYDCPY